MRKQLAALTITSVLAAAFAFGAAGVANAAPAPATSSVVTSASHAHQRATVAPVDINQVLPDGSTLAGQFTVTKFVVQNGHVVADGVMNGTLTSAAGVVQQLTNSPGSSVVSTATNGAASSAAMAQAAAAGSCSILSLQLGPLHLDLLGLVVDLNQVNLDITAVPGAGNLLGNLLCSVAGLLDGGTGLQGVVNILNNLLGLLGGL
jgi:hypothetical protein